MATQPPAPSAPEEAAKHVTIWNRIEHRKIAGNAAPLRRNLESYLRKHPDCEEYKGQDKDPNRAPIDPVTGHRILHLNEHVPIWHTMENRKVTGNAAPLRKNLAAYLRKHPQCEVYNNQDKRLRQTNSVPVWGTHPSQSSSGGPHTSPFASVPGVSFRRADGEHGNGTLRINTAGASNHAGPGTVGPMRDMLYRNEVASSANLMAKFAQMQGGRSQHLTPLNGPAHPFQTAIPFAASSPPSGSPAPGTPSYAEMVSSWSNQPEWIRFLNHTSSGFNGPPAMGTPQQCPSQFYLHSAMDTGDNDVNGIPIPGRSSKDAGDIVMEGSLGGQLGFSAQMGDLALFLGNTPRSLDTDPDMMQFSPSNYLTSGTPACSPPVWIAHQQQNGPTTLSRN